MNKITQTDINNVNEDTQKELWGTGQTFIESAKKHLASISTKSRKDPTYQRDKVITNWTLVSPEARLEYIRGNINDATQEAIEDLDEERKSAGIPEPVRRDREDRKKKKEKHKHKKDNKKEKHKKKKRRRRRRHKHKPGENPNNPATPQNPNPIQIEDPDVVEEEPIILIPPSPREVESPPIPPAPNKLSWNSRIGYFVSLSDITWYEEVPKIIESPYVDINFNETSEGFLRLKSGQHWTSDWYDTGVIRGLNIDVLGKHKINYAKNGDFET